MGLKEQIKYFCNNMGLTEVGFCKCEPFFDLKHNLSDRAKKGLKNEFEHDNIDERITPNYYMKDGNTIISIAFPYLYDYKDNLEMYFSVYTRGLDYHMVISEYLRKLCAYIETIGGNANYFVDSNYLPERYIARKSGLGFIGKNNMLINQKYGSYVFLGEVITDLNIEPDSPIENKCGNCRLCMNACPTKAINEKENNPNICLSYITQKKDIDDLWFSKLSGRLFGCDTCQNICPYNACVKHSRLSEFKPLEFMTDIDIDELINLNNNIFKQKYKMTSAGWRGKNILIRNAMINMMSNEHQKLGKIDVKSPYIFNYYNRLLHYYKL